MPIHIPAKPREEKWKPYTVKIHKTVNCPFCDYQIIYYDSTVEVYICPNCGRTWK